MASMRRRDVIGALAVLGGAVIARPVTALAQQPKRLRVGTANILPKERSGTLPGFEERMAQLGYEQGKNFDLEFVQVPSVGDYGATYREIVARKVDVILALGPEIALKSALAVAGSLPIVMIAIDYDPLARGYVPSLARPSGNITGVFFQQIELTTKRLQLMKEALPEMKAVTVLWDRMSADQWREAERAAATLGLRVLGTEMRAQPYNYDGAFAQARQDFGIFQIGSNGDAVGLFMWPPTQPCSPLCSCCAGKLVMPLPLSSAYWNSEYVAMSSVSRRSVAVGNDATFERLRRSGPSNVPNPAKSGNRQPVRPAGHHAGAGVGLVPVAGASAPK